MLTEQDALWIKNNRKEITAKREWPITIAYTGAGVEDDITGEIIGGGEERREVMAPVTEMSSSANTGIERLLINGVAVESGDVWLSIDFDLVADIADKIERVRYDGRWYSVMASDKKGIGLRNRVEVLGRVIT